MTSLILLDGSVEYMGLWSSRINVTDATMANNTTLIDDTHINSDCSLNPDIAGIGVSNST